MSYSPILRFFEDFLYTRFTSISYVSMLVLPTCKCLSGCQGFGKYGCATA